MSEWANGFVEANGLRIFYHRSSPGSGKPPVLLLHGFTDNGLCWSRVARELEASYDLIMPDARGHGRTQGPASDMAIDLLAEDAAALIRGLGLENPCVFGHSLGAMTALFVAAGHPDLVRAAILEDPPFWGPEQFTRAVEQHLHKVKEDLAFQAVPLTERIAYCQAENPGWSPDEILPWAQSKGEYRPEIMGIRLHRETSEPAWREALRRVECPLLLISGDPHQGAIVTEKIAEQASQLGKQCEVAHIPGAGHCIHRDRYEETMRAVTDFLGRFSGSRRHP